ncbi:MAG: serine protease, partial [Gammaproteobacteria bacterium]|nr:serine protease [Gammaproteobacteria bacterium]
MRSSLQQLANFEDDEDFATIEPFPHQTQMSIMPVVAMKGQYLRGVGTCFAISSQGLVLTARHVIEDALELDEHGEKKDTDLWIGALYAAEPEPEDVGRIPDLLGGLIPARRVHYSESHDIALMHLSVPKRRTTGERLQMPQLKLGMQIPQEGKYCVGIGYHSMDWKQATGPHTHEIVQSYSASQGHIGRVHLIKRDD